MSTPITVSVTPDIFSDIMIASWDDASGGGLTTQGKTISELVTNVAEAARLHFEAEMPEIVYVKFDFTINVR